MSVGLYTDMDDMYDSENATDIISSTSPAVPIIGAASIFAGVLLLLLSIVTVAGNIGTIWAFRSNILLRQKPSNLLILSLSCCDLAVGATGLPVAAVHTGLGYWPLGKPVCIISAFFSVIGVSAGMYTVTAISVDRWLLVSREYPSYLRIQSSRNVKLQIAGAWIAAILISSCETILWVVRHSDDSFETIDYTSQCISPVRSNQIFIMVIFALLFAIPFIVMVFSTLRFVVLLRRRLRKSRKRRTMSIVSSNNVIANIKREPSVTSSVDNSVYDNKAFDGPSKNPTTSENPKVASQVSVTFDKTIPPTKTNNDTKTAPTQRPVKHPSLGQTGRGKSFFGLGSDASLGASTRNRRAIKMKNRYMKPAIRLAILLGVFALCTLPYPIFIILSDETLVEARNHLSNLLLSNSGLNPFLYAIMHRKIRLFYISKLTSPCCRKRNM